MTLSINFSQFSRHVASAMLLKNRFCLKLKHHLSRLDGVQIILTYTFNSLQYFFDSSLFRVPKKLFLIGCFLIAFVSLSSAQNSALRSLEQKATNFLSSNYDSALYHFVILDSLAELENDTFCRISAMSFFASHFYMAKDDVKSAEYCDKLIPIVTNPSEMITVYNQCGSAYQNFDAAKAESFYLKAIQVAQENNITSLNVPAVLSNYASFLMYKGDYEQSIIYYIDALKYDISDFSKVTTLKNISNNYLNTSNLKRAKESCLEAAKIAEENKFNVRNGHLAWMLSRVALKENDIETAHLEIDRAIEYFKGKKNVSYVQALIHKAKIFIHENDWKSVKEQYQLMQPFIGELENLKQIPVLMLETRIANHDKDYKTAIRKSNETLKILESVEDETNRMNAYGSLALAYKGLGQKDHAYEYLAKKEKLANSLFRTEQSRLVAQLEAEYERNEQDQKIDYLDKENQSKSLIVSSQKRSLYIGGFALALISLLSFFLFRLYKKVNGQKKIIIKALSEKDILLREIHHRVKNNLQLVSSLLTLQGKSISDQTALEAINEGKSRVRSMALIHQDLYNKENLTGISIKDYLEKLTKELFYTYNIEEDKIKLNLNIEELELDVDTIVPLGLIINELITNCLKYAFPENAEGVLNISIQKVNDKLVLEVSDNGIGYDLNSIGDGSFGSTLITALTEQLEGVIQIKSENGTHVKIVFEGFKTL